MERKREQCSSKKNRERNKKCVVRASATTEALSMMGPLSHNCYTFGSYDW
jgi:hypothetical protein